MAFVSPYFPAEAVSSIEQLLIQYRIRLCAKKRRHTKLGDFKPGNRGNPHQITINSDLNPYAFLLVFLHELAHLQVWEAGGQKPRPHGQEWKRHFGELIREHIDLGHFHASLGQALFDYSFNVKAGGIAGPEVQIDLRRFDSTESDETFFLEELPEEAFFVTHNGKNFQKKKKIRTRYQCFCTDNKRTYLFPPMARVQIKKQAHIIT
jgi:SprT protein